MLARKLTGEEANHFDDVMDLKWIQRELEKAGFEVTISEFAALDLTRNYQGYYVLYASSEEKGLFYKSYIGDVILRLQMDGAVLLPSYPHFQCHHNKSFAEMYRAGLQEKELRTPASHSIGHIEELALIKDRITYPVVVKTAAGSGSIGVKLARTEEEMTETVKHMMRHTYRNQEFTWIREFGNKPFGHFLKKTIKKLTNEQHLAPRDEPYYTNKVLLQQMIPDLSGDYKVLYFYGKYYCLGRKNRDNDFRASGSGKFSYPENLEEIENVLLFARKAVEEFKEPVISLDIAENENGCYLIEFQFLFFGPHTLQYSNWYFTYDEERHGFVKVEGKSELETEYARSVAEYIKALETESSME